MKTSIPPSPNTVFSEWCAILASGFYFSMYIRRNSASKTLEGVPPIENVGCGMWLDSANCMFTHRGTVSVIRFVQFKQISLNFTWFVLDVFSFNWIMLDWLGCNLININWKPIRWKHLSLIYKSQFFKKRVPFPSIPLQISPKQRKLNWFQSKPITGTNHISQSPLINPLTLASNPLWNEKGKVSQTKLQIRRQVAFV